jgi:outer membrane cobalamin receptor
MASFRVFPWLGLLAATAAACAADDPQQELPKPLHEQVIVTAAAQPQELGQAAALVSLLTNTELSRSPGMTLDDALRDVPGFTLFRRTSSLVAHPTTQGVSLRGIGPSGAGRTLVLFDGIPLNDPFGGWVYWNRVPQEAIESVEVARGAASGLYGSSAMGGAIQILSRPPDLQAWTLEGFGGTRGTFDGSTIFSERRGKWSYSLAGSLFGTDGFYLLAAANRGKVDIPADSRYQTFDGRFTYGDWHFGANLYHEDRGNGTPLQVNNSHMELFDLGVKKKLIQWNVYGQPGWFYSAFSSIPTNRNSETLTIVQNVPTAALGSSVVITPETTSWGKLMAGADWRYDRANSKAQNLSGVFLQDSVTLNSRVTLLAGARADEYQNRGTHGTADPRLGLTVRAAEKITLRASTYRGFRAVTLNELYRPFQQGSTLTLPNADLRAESLWGGEVGADFYPVSWALLRVNGFWNALNNPVGTGPTSVIAGQTYQTRQNIGSATVRGVETEGQIRRGHWMARTSYLFSEATVDATGLWLVQTARQQGSGSVVYSGPVIITGDVRLASRQFDNSPNTISLAGYSTFGFSVRRVLTKRVEVFAAGENMLNRQIAIAHSPIEQLGTPRLVHAGAKFKLGKMK